MSSPTDETTADQDKNQPIGSGNDSDAQIVEKVPALPAPDAGLAAWLHRVMPPTTALAISTPLVRVPITARPPFTAADLDEHRRDASVIWSAGWGLREISQRWKALDGTPVTEGMRYLRAVERAPWLSLALQRAGVSDWRSRLFLLESWTRPPVEWASLADPVGLPPRLYADCLPATPQPGMPVEQVTTESRRVYLAILVDLGSAELDPLAIWGEKLRWEDEDEHKSSKRLRLLAAGDLVGLGRKGRLTRKPVRRALNEARELLHAVGAWPWAHAPNGELPIGWWRDAEIAAAIHDWLDRALRQEHLAHQRRAGFLRRPNSK